MARSVAIVGAGVSGLACIKCCLEEGLKPTCFERSDDLGGLWRFTEHVEEGRASLYESVVSNSSKEMSCYADFPFPEDCPNYVPNSHFLDYLQKYAERFQLRACIRFKTKVCSVTKRPDFEVSGQWEVVTQRDGERESAIFDAVMVCTGYLTNPHLPLDSFPGIKTFQGQYFHSRQYKHPDIFKDKRVLVIGMGNSGTDIAVEASHVAKKVLLSTTSGAWVLSRISSSGYPWDMMFTTRFQTLLRNLLPTPLVMWLLARKVNSWFDHASYGVLPTDRMQMREPVFNDELPGRIITGKVLVRPGVREVRAHSVLFHDAAQEEPVDIIVFATGYTFAFPFLDETVVRVEEGQASLYKYVVPAHLPRPTLAVISLIKPFGSMVPTAETQARWAVRVFKGAIKLPPVHVMMEEVRVRRLNKHTGFGFSFCKPLQSDYIPYLDELLADIGAKPNLPALLLTDPRLAYALFFGPYSPYQFRLTGPGKWAGARSAILSQWDRTVKVTRTRVVHEAPWPVVGFLRFLGVLVVLVALVLVLL